MEPFSGEKYREVESLFSWRDELSFLQSQSGYQASIGREFKESRQRLANRWLAQIRAEFDELYEKGQLLLIQSSVDRPDLVTALFRVRTRFYRTFVSLRLRLLIGCSLQRHARVLTTSFEELIGYTLIAEAEVNGLI
ncbi:MAG: hypothetical protein QOJ99_835 [Bryobacterales bacterium]|nr:hypothetical protein [Bryobacterales bacterium]